MGGCRGSVFAVCVLVALILQKKPQVNIKTKMKYYICTVSIIICSKEIRVKTVLKIMFIAQTV